MLLDWLLGDVVGRTILFVWRVPVTAIRLLLWAVLVVTDVVRQDRARRRRPRWSDTAPTYGRDRWTS